MPSLADYQRRMFEALLGSSAAASRDLESLFARPSCGLRIHQNTIRQGLSSALQMTFSTVARLVGSLSFDELAGEYIRACPPRAAVLYEYGRGFPEYLRHAVPQHACLPHVARLDLAIDQAGRELPGEWGDPIPVDPNTTLMLARSVRCEQYDYAVDTIRDAVIAADRHIEPELQTPTPRNLALWREPAGVSVKPLAPPAFIFLQSLLRGQDVHQALACSMREHSLEETVTAIHHDVFHSSFCRVEPCPS